MAKSRREISRDYVRRRRQAILDLLGARCVRCGFDDKRALQIDHINGGGHQDRLKYGSGHSFYNHVIKDILDGEIKYQILCANCNWIKRVIEGEDLHEGNAPRKDSPTNTRG